MSILLLIFFFVAYIYSFYEKNFNNSKIKDTFVLFYKHYNLFSVVHAVLIMARSDVVYVAKGVSVNNQV